MGFTFISFGLIAWSPFQVMGAGSTRGDWQLPAAAPKLSAA